MSCGNFYEGRQTDASSVNDRYIEINYEGAAWRNKMVMRIHISPEVPLPQVQSWLSQLQALSPKMNSAAPLPNLQGDA